jgi:molecular chaperone Hsp33
MSADQLVRGYFSARGLKASVVVVTRAAREGQKLHGLHDVAAMMLGQALAAGALLVSLQKDQTRVNLQLECDGPMRGLFVDAGAEGYLRGYVKNPYLAVEGSRGAMRWRPALGNSGFLSVLKDIGEGEFYRSSVELKAMELATDFEGYFAASEQVPTRVALGVERRGDEPLGAVAGVLVQALPEADASTLEQVTAALGARLDEALAGGRELTAAALLEMLLPGFAPTNRVELGWRCSCSKDRVLAALSGLGKVELEDMLATDGKAAASCQFCGRRHEASADDLKALIAAC